MRRKFIIITLCTGLGLIFGLPKQAQANLLTNGDFEKGTLTGWTTDWNSDNIGISGKNPQDGKYHARNYWDGGKYQDISIVSGETFRMTGYAYIPSPQNGGSGGGSQWGTYIGLRFLDSEGKTVADYQTDMQHFARDYYNLADTTWVTSPAKAVTARARFGTWGNAPNKPVYPTDFDTFELLAMPHPPLTLPLRVNCGKGEEYIDSEGNKWVLTPLYTPGNWGRATGCYTYDTSRAIPNTQDDYLFSSVYYDQQLDFLFDLPNGLYNVKLLFIEPYFTAAGKRIFDVFIENALVLDDYDIYAETGWEVAVIKEFNNINVTDGQLNIDLSRVIDNAAICGIYIDVIPEPQSLLLLSSGLATLLPFSKRRKL